VARASTVAHSVFLVYLKRITLINHLLDFISPLLELLVVVVMLSHLPVLFVNDTLDTTNLVKWSIYKTFRDILFFLSLDKPLDLFFASFGHIHVFKLLRLFVLKEWVPFLAQLKFDNTDGLWDTIYVDRTEVWLEFLLRNRESIYFFLL